MRRLVWPVLLVALCTFPQSAAASPAMVGGADGNGANVGTWADSVSTGTGGAGPGAQPHGSAHQSGLGNGPPTFAPSADAPCPVFDQAWSIPGNVAQGNDIPPRERNGSTLEVIPTVSDNPDGSVTATYGPVSFAIGGGVWGGFAAAGSPTYTVTVQPEIIPSVSQQDMQYLQWAQPVADLMNQSEAAQLPPGAAPATYVTAADIVQHTEPATVGATAYADELHTFDDMSTVEFLTGRMQPPSHAAGYVDAKTQAFVQTGWLDSWTCQEFAPSVAMDQPTLIKPQPSTPDCVAVGACLDPIKAEFGWAFANWRAGTLNSAPSANAATIVHVPTYFWIDGSARPNSFWKLGTWSHVAGSNPTKGADVDDAWSEVDVMPSTVVWHFDDGPSQALGRGSALLDMPSYEGAAEAWSDGRCINQCVTHRYDAVGGPKCVYASQTFSVTFQGYYNAGGGRSDVAFTSEHETVTANWPQVGNDPSQHGCYDLTVNQIEGVPTG